MFPRVPLEAAHCDCQALLAQVFGPRELDTILAGSTVVAGDGFHQWPCHLSASVSHHLLPL